MRCRFLRAALGVGAACLTLTVAFPDALPDQVDTLFERYGKPGSPGAAVAIMRDGEAVYSNGYGMVQIEYGIPITPATVFHVASVSKQFTAFAVVLLAHDGKLSLDDDIRDHIAEAPGFGQSRPIPLSPMSPVEFRPADTPSSLLVQLDIDEYNEVRTLLVSPRGRQTVEYEAVRPPERSPEYLQPFAGRYYSKELETTYTIGFDGKRLWLERPKYPRSALTPHFRDGFGVGPGLARFFRNADGKPEGFRLNSGRILNIRFDRSP